MVIVKMIRFMMYSPLSFHYVYPVGGVMTIIFAMKSAIFMVSVVNVWYDKAGEFILLIEKFNYEACLYYRWVFSFINIRGYLDVFKR
jgi:hypothetical protein